MFPAKCCGSASVPGSLGLNRFVFASQSVFEEVEKEHHPSSLSFLRFQVCGYSGFMSLRCVCTCWSERLCQSAPSSGELVELHHLHHLSPWLVLLPVGPVLTSLWCVFILWSYEGVTASSDQMQTDTGLKRKRWAEFPPHTQASKLTWREFSRWEHYLDCKFVRYINIDLGIDTTNKLLDLIKLNL